MRNPRDRNAPIRNPQRYSTTAIVHPAKSGIGIQPLLREGPPVPPQADPSLTKERHSESRLKIE